MKDAMSHVVVFLPPTRQDGDEIAIIQKGVLVPESLAATLPLYTIWTDQKSDVFDIY